MGYVAVTFFVVIAMSAMIIWGCFSVRSWLLPLSDEVFLNVEQTYADGSASAMNIRVKIGESESATPGSMLVEDGKEQKVADDVRYSITSIENNFTMLSPKRQLLYHTCGAAMVALPFVFSLAGILLCGLQFYKKRLKKPIDLLSSATEKIAEQDLDFTVTAPSDDELGVLCTSFEQMRQALAENNKKMWNLLEERRQLQASVAHDLRNPIAIIEGHAQYLQMNLPEGKLSEEKITSIAGNIEKAAKRLESYTESIGAIHHLEELEMERKPVSFAELVQDMEADFARMTGAHGCHLVIGNQVTKKTLDLDPQILYRILENLLGNAVRYAKDQIGISFDYEDSILKVCVTDDGPGFSDKILRAKNTRFVSDSKEAEHSGIGLTVCRILCGKHGGAFSIGNREEGGACIKFSLSV